MLNVRSFHFYLFFCGLVALTACTADHETVDAKDDQGRPIHYVRRKKDFAKDGLYQRFLESGSIAEEAEYANDTLNGFRKYYYPNGTLESVEHFRRGNYHGKYQKYYPDGKLQIDQEFVEGALQGLSLSYYPNGTLKEKVTLKDNDENGPFFEYYENGNLKTEGNYLPGEDLPLEEGPLKEYDENGQLVRIADCKAGRCTTQWKKE
jgi:antitoxin component YwqK of YwqJK toxin-antitoxin module